MPALATVSGPLPKLGVIVVSLLVAGVLLAREPRGRALATLAALILAPVLLAAELWHSPQLSIVHRHSLYAVVGIVVGIAILLGLARLLTPRRALVAPLAVFALPFRVPIQSGGTTSNLLVPLYLVVAVGCLAWMIPVLRDEVREPLVADGSGGWAVRVERLLALVIVLYGIQSAYSSDFEKALQQMVFFYVPFALLYRLVRDLSWDRTMVTRCLRLLAVLAIAFAAIGFVEYATKTIILNPKLVVANDLHTYFTVNSVFFDPDIFGRFLALTMVLLAVLLIYDRDQREQTGVIVVLAVLWAGLVLTLSRSSLGALLVGLGVLAALRWRPGRALVIALAVVLLGAVAVAASPRTFGLNQGINGASSGRGGLVSGGITLFGQRPLYGYGSGSFVTEYRRAHRRTATTLSASHTIPVTIAAEQGIIGELAYIALVVCALVCLLRRARGDPVRSAVAAAFTALVFHTMLYADFLEDPVTWVLLGAGVALAVALPGGTLPPSPDLGRSRRPRPGAALEG
ncbi:MAG TPA: O-antigen ligase family protein [Solirubrobacteraceae bacterium]|nr:O-antigen ligase family protein [Solirubrobacteraceae bacterium]